MFLFFPNSFVGGRQNAKDRFIPIIDTRPHDNPRRYNGANNNITRIKVEANYFALQSRNTTTAWEIYKYHVTFEPECLMRGLKMFLVGVHKSQIGGYLFDGAQLYTTRPLHRDSNEVEFTSETKEHQVYKVKMMFTNIVRMNAKESLQVLNLILRRNMNALNMQIVGRNFYDPGNMVNFLRYFMPFLNEFNHLNVFIFSRFRLIYNSSEFKCGPAMRHQFVITKEDAFY